MLRAYLHVPPSPLNPGLEPARIYEEGKNRSKDTQHYFVTNFHRFANYGVSVDFSTGDNLVDRLLCDGQFLR
jgi:hypothetical protein